MNPPTDEDIAACVAAELTGRDILREHAVECPPIVPGMVLVPYEYEGVVRRTLFSVYLWKNVYRNSDGIIILATDYDKLIKAINETKQPPKISP